MNTFGFTCEKRPATGSKGMVVTNHPLASGAGAQILLGGGNAIDAAIAALFVLTVVEPMMVGLAGGGMAHIRLADGTQTVLDGISTAPRRARPDMYRTVSDVLPDYQETVDRQNHRGPLAVAVPGALAGWCLALERFGTVSLADALAPAIAIAERGFTTTPYLTTCTGDCAADLLQDPELAAMFMPDGAPIQPGTTLRRPDYAETLRLIARLGPAALYHGPLGAELTGYMQSEGGLIEQADLAAYRVKERAPISGRYRGFEIVGPPPPSSAGVHIVQMLNMLEHYDVRRLGFGTVDGVHLLAEVLKIAFADRAVGTADPDFVPVPVERLTSRAFADQRRAGIDMHRAQTHRAGLALAAEGTNTTHVTVADAEGNVVASTQTINSLFGARVAVPGTGVILNNYMFNFDPHPGNALSIEPGKRVFTSMAPMMALRDGTLAYALGLPGALRIFPSALQALINLIDHGMTLQEAVEAPRVFTQGHMLELETALFERLAPALRERGHAVQEQPRIGGGMNAIAFRPDGTLTGAACWRADGTPVAIAGGLARAGVRFVI
ncbi:MAG TPA: gamma-glutamyltransferase [Acetobacteraceae bacterium]|nr:gamma-glutamyltransferase [Acetobacteraceae bacterium]